MSFFFHVLHWSRFIFPSAFTAHLIITSVLLFSLLLRSNIRALSWPLYLEQHFTSPAAFESLEHISNVRFYIGASMGGGFLSLPPLSPCYTRSVFAKRQMCFHRSCRSKCTYTQATREKEQRSLRGICLCNCFELMGRGEIIFECKGNSNKDDENNGHLTMV